MYCARLLYCMLARIVPHAGVSSSTMEPLTEHVDARVELTCLDSTPHVKHQVRH